MGARKGGELDGAKGWCHTSGVVGLPFRVVTIIPRGVSAPPVKAPATAAWFFGRVGALARRRPPGRLSSNFEGKLPHGSPENQTPQPPSHRRHRPLTSRLLEPS